MSICLSRWSDAIACYLYEGDSLDSVDFAFVESEGSSFDISAKHSSHYGDLKSSASTSSGFMV